MATYAIRYGDVACKQKQNLPGRHRKNLEELERKLQKNPFGHGAKSNGDNSWTAPFSGGMILYTVSNRHVVINIIRIVAV